jgi:hypothetical protein
MRCTAVLGRASALGTGGDPQMSWLLYVQAFAALVILLRRALAPRLGVLRDARHERLAAQLLAESRASSSRVESPQIRRCGVIHKHL